MFEIGDKVILRKGSSYFSSALGERVGRVTQVTWNHETIFTNGAVWVKWLDAGLIFPYNPGELERLPRNQFKIDPTLPNI